MDILRKSWINRLEIIMTFGLGVMWILAAKSKLTDPVGFLESIEAYQLIDGNLAAWTALWMPVFEGLLGIALLFRYKLYEIARISFILLTFFFLLLIITKIRGIDINCGCFSQDAGETLWEAIARDFILILINWFVIKVHKP